jgi:FtsP/CotA-like multicopper oxidase with cupredoxin domain
MHGHDFALIGQSTQPWNITESPKQFNFTNPPRRDVALLPRGGWLALAFKSDNPGVWLVHCQCVIHVPPLILLKYPHHLRFWLMQKFS